MDAITNLVHCSCEFRAKLPSFRRTYHARVSRSNSSSDNIFKVNDQSSAKVKTFIFVLSENLNALYISTSCFNIQRVFLKTVSGRCSK